MSHHEEEEPSYGGTPITWLNVNAKEGVFQKKEKGKPTESFGEIRGNLKRVWYSWDDGSVEHKVKAGYRWEIELEDALLIEGPKDGKRVDAERTVLRVRAQVYGYCLVPLLMAVQKGERVGLVIRMSEDRTTAFPRMVVFRDGKWEKLKADHIEGKDATEKALKSTEMLKGHPAFAEPPKKQDGGAWEEFDKVAQEHGWPLAGVAQDLYLALASEFVETVYESLSDVTKESWDDLIELVKDSAKSGKVPKALTIWRARNKPEPAVNPDEYDPFADE